MKSENPPVHIILHNPKIPQNTGNIGRMCSIIGARLHLIHPLGFIITDSKLKRSGMDYWYELDIVHHKDWESFKASPLAPDLSRIWLFTTKGDKCLWDAKFRTRRRASVRARRIGGCPQRVHDDLDGAPPENSGSSRPNCAR